MTNVNETMKENQAIQVAKYLKRPGTSAVSGSLYRSHLLSLIISRNLNNEIKFILGCNVDEIGVMCEICFRFLLKDNKNKPVAVFIKSKYTKSAFNLYKCYQSSILIKERFDNNTDALFDRKFDSIEPYFVIYTPHQRKIENHVVVSKDDKIYTDEVHNMISTGNNNNIFKLRGESLVTDFINETIELMGTTIAAYVTSADVQNREINEEMKNILVKYNSFLIPDVIKVNNQDHNYSGEFNKSMYENNNSHIQLLKKVLFTEILKKLKVKDEEASTNIQLLLETNEYTADLLSTLVGTIITFDEKTNKLEYMFGVSDFIKKPLDEIKVGKAMVDEAFVIAGMKALKCIKINFNGLDMEQIITKQDKKKEQKKSENVFESEKQIAERFLEHLYIYTDQGNQKDLDKLLKEEIVKSQITNKNNTIFQSKTEAAFVKFHYKVQEWMLSIDKPQYLTNSCDFLKAITNIVDPHLSILNYNCIMELQRYSIKFNSKSFNSFTKLVDTQSCTNIVSNNVLLTSIKLMQYFSDKSCLFIDLDHVCNMKDMEFNKLIQEVNKATVKKLVLILRESKKHTTESDQLQQIVVNFPQQVVVVSNHEIENFETIYDVIKGLEDTDNINDLLKHEITVQGEKVELGKIVDKKSKNLINAKILYKIIKNEKIEVGESLCNSFYNEIKDCFEDRKLIKYYDGFFNEVLIIYAEPGMGKSTLLTHVSVKIKRAYPKKWIVRINLLNFCEDFFKWEEEETDVDLIRSMYLVCRAGLNHKGFDKLFALEKGPESDLVLIESKELDPIASLYLNLIIDCFNSGNVLFLFDGFDEICPHYEKVAVKFIKTFLNKGIMDYNTDGFRFDALSTPQIINSQLLIANVCLSDISKETKRKNQIWITSRPYNAIETTLGTEFYTIPLHIQRLSTNEQYHFYKMYWETLLKMEELNSDQFQNVEAFFEHMNQYRLTDDFFKTGILTITNNMLLRRMQEAAVYYFRSKIFRVADEDMPKLAVLNSWISPMDMYSVDDNLCENDNHSEELQLAGIPLHMKIHADLFINQIKDTSSTKQWDMGVHTYEFYNRFLELKLKKIRFEEKANENVHTSTFLIEYEDLVAEVTEEHKKLAFYAFFHNSSSHIKKVLPDSQWIKIQPIIKRIKRAEEKTGLIDRIHNGVPRFVHLIFAEYYAVEYVADMLKRSPVSNDKVRQQIDFVVDCLLNSSLGIMRVFNQKLKDDKKLQEVLDTDYTRQCIFTVWMEQHVSCEGDINRKSCLKNVLENKLIETAWFLLTSIRDTLNYANIETFVDSIGSEFFQLTITSDDLIRYVLDAIRRVDPSMVVKALLNCDLQLGNFPENEIILQNLRNRYPRKTLIPESPHRFLGRLQ